MTTKQILYMIAHVSLQMAAGILIGAWLGVQYPDAVKAIFAAPIAGLVAALFSLKMSYDKETLIAKGGSANDNPKV